MSATTQQYMAYCPQEDLAQQMDVALSLAASPDAGPDDAESVASLFGASMSRSDPPASSREPGLFLVAVREAAAACHRL